MSKSLSQDEIDLLLQASSSGADSAEALDRLDTMLSQTTQRILPYNFKRPRLFSQDQMRVLNYVHESFARDLSVYLSAQLRTIVELQLKAVDQVLYSEYVMSSAPPTALYVIKAEPPLDQRFIIEVDPRLAIYTIEKLFGGPGIFLQEPRVISHIEQRIMSRVMERALRELERAWHQAQDLRLNEVAFESNAEFVQIIPGMEAALVCTFEVGIHDQISLLTICYPYILLEKILGRAGLNQWIAGTTRPVSEPVRNRFEDNLRKLSVELTAELGRTHLPIQELVHLQEGDVLPLGRRPDEPIELRVNREVRFLARMGRSGQRRAARIVAVLPPEPELPSES